MRLANILQLYRTRLRFRLGQELLALLGIAAGVALVLAALVANTSLTASFQRTVHSVVGDARLEVVARGAGIDAAVIDAAKALPDVTAASGLLATHALLHGAHGTRSIALVGVASDFASVNGGHPEGLIASARYFSRQRVIAVPAPLARAIGITLGQQIRLDVSGRVQRVTVAALLDSQQIGELADVSLGLAPLAYAQALAGQPGEVTHAFVIPARGHDRNVADELRTIVGSTANVEPSGFEADIFRQTSQPTNQSTAMFSVLGALVGFLFALSAVLLTAPDRRHLIADLAREGYGRRTLLAVIVVDAVILGLAGSAAGVVAGVQVAHHLFAHPPSFLGLAFTFAAHQHVSIPNVAVAAASGLAASVVAVLTPTAEVIFRASGAQAASETPPLRRWRIERPTLVGAGFLLAAIAIAARTPRSVPVGIVGLALMTAAMMLVLPDALHLAAVTLSHATSRIRSVVPTLTIDLKVRASRLRALAVAATGALAVFGSVALQGAQADLQRGLDRASHDQARVGDLWVMAPGSGNLLATVAFPPPGIHLPAEIARTDPYRGGFLDIADRRAWMIAVPSTATRPVPRNQILRGEERLVDERIRHGGWVVLSEGVAHDLGTHVDEVVTLPSPRPLRLRVAAISTNMGWPPGAVLLNATDYARAWNSDDVAALTATLAPGTTPAAGKAALQRALGADSGLVVKTAADRERALRHGSRQGLERLSQIAILVLIAAMIAMATTMASRIWQRRGFFNAIKIEGYGSRELWRALLLESTLLMGVACLTGAVVGLLGQRLLSRALTAITGFPVIYAPALRVALLSCIVVTLASVSIVAYVGYLATRGDVGASDC